MRDPEFTFARAEDKDVTSQAKVDRLEQVYTAKAQRTGASELARQAIRALEGRPDALAGVVRALSAQVQRQRLRASHQPGTEHHQGGDGHHEPTGARSAPGAAQARP